jgi:mono/diheme cytochrome c family protein
MAKFMTMPTALVVSIALLLPASAQSIDPSVGQHLAETTCSACHQIGSAAPKSETRRAEFLGHHSHAVDERTRDQGVPPFFASDNAEHHTEP